MSPAPIEVKRTGRGDEPMITENWGMRVARGKMMKAMEAFDLWWGGEMAVVEMEACWWFPEARGEGELKKKRKIAGEKSLHLREEGDMWPDFFFQL